MEEHKDVKCGKCKTYRYPSQFLKNGRKMKTCQICRDNAKRSREKNKCIHKKQENNCKECMGSSFCEHLRMRQTCKICIGSSICSHMNRKQYCRDCRDCKIIVK